ncbi:MAG TPA: hypothetical protein VH185_09065 [Mycobacterium sp.]|jgi:hypothetical protein|nr:hypothetical protein [Mycobacterium sp.]
MSTRQAKILGYTAVLFVGIATAEVFGYATRHQTIHLIIGAVAAIIAVLIIGTTALVARRSGKPPKSPVD